MTGLIIVFDEEKRKYSLEERVYYGSFSDALSVSDWPMKELQVCLLSFDDEKINEACIAKKQWKVATAKNRIEFSDFVQFEPAIRFDELEKEIGNRFKSHFTYTSDGQGGNFPPKTWDEVWKALIKLRPKYKDSLLGLIEKCTQSSIIKRDKIHQTIAQEKDSVQLSLDISGFERKGFRNNLFYREREKPAPFLQGIQEASLIEDRMLDHDMSVFGDWTSIKKYQVGATTFKKRDQSLTIVNVNRGAIEHALGVDLIYYNHSSQSYVLVQYKRLNKTSTGNHEFRPDEQFNKEKKRMEKFSKENPIKAVPKGKPSFWYRLNPEIFYFKFCYDITFSPLSSDLIKGFYLPLDYLNIYINSGELKGPRGGAVLSHKNIGRNFNNSFFIDLVQHGWIGSRLKTTDSLTKIIKDKLQAGRSVMLARTKHRDETEDW